jgi:pimeloyl-ACP methyl ester carboxylesterase
MTIYFISGLGADERAFQKLSLPTIYKLIGFLKINKLAPQSMLNKVFPFAHWYFGTNTNEEKVLLSQIIHDTPAPFLKWAINEILHWKNTERSANIFHIHGTKDRIFPISNLKVDLKINEGGHFMVYTKADEISRILAEKLNQ